MRTSTAASVGNFTGSGMITSDEVLFAPVEAMLLDGRGVQVDLPFDRR